MLARPSSGLPSAPIRVPTEVGGSPSPARIRDRTAVAVRLDHSLAASTEASAVMLTRRRTVAVGVRMCAGRASPSRIGPTVMPWPEVALSTLKVMLAASSVGITSRLASRVSAAPGKSWSSSSRDKAASPCISPSTSNAGWSERINSSARRILRALAVSSLPKLECDSRATCGLMPKRRISSAASTAISASCSGLGSGLT